MVEKLRQIGLYGGYHKATGPIGQWDRWKVKIPYQTDTFDWSKVKKDDVIAIYSADGLWNLYELPDFLRTAPVNVQNPLCISEELGLNNKPMIAEWSDVMRSNGFPVVHNYGFLKNVVPIARTVPTADMSDVAELADRFSLHYYSQSNGGTSRDTIRRKFDQYSATGKPVDLLIWASSPKYAGKKSLAKKWRYPSAAALIDSEWWQISEARARGWRVELFCSNGKGGNVAKWLADPHPETVKLRAAVNQLLASV
jgi:hypothetical protein